MRKLGIVTAFAVLLSSFALAQAESVEKLMGYTFDKDGITFQVRSYGCTKKTDFKFKVVYGNVTSVELLREKMDPCQRVKPFGTEIKFSWDEIGEKGLHHTDFTVTNPHYEVHHLIH